MFHARSTDRKQRGLGAEGERDEESRERNNEKKGITTEIVHGKTTRDSVYWRWRRCKGSLGPARHQVVEREAHGEDWGAEEGGREGGRAREAQTRDSMLESKHTRARIHVICTSSVHRSTILASSRPYVSSTGSSSHHLSLLLGEHAPSLQDSSDAHTRSSIFLMSPLPSRDILPSE